MTCRALLVAVVASFAVSAFGANHGGAFSWPGYVLPPVPSIAIVNWNSPQAIGLVGLWRVSGSSILNDLSGRGLSMTIGGTPDPVSTEYGPAFIFDGGGDYFEHDGTVSLPSVYPHTVASWVKHGYGANDITVGLFVGDASVDNNYIALDINNNGSNTHSQYTYRDGVTNKFCRDNTDPVAGGLYLLVGVSVSSTEHYFYVNGVQKCTDTTSATPANLDRIAIGAFRDSTPFYGEGYAIEARIYDRALSASEVWRMYNATTRNDIWRKPVAVTWSIGAAPASGQPMWLRHITVPHMGQGGRLPR